MERKIMICECHSLEHQVIFWLDEEYGELYCEPHLTTRRNFFKRLWYGLKYAFGYKSKYGAWDETIFKREDLEKLRTYLNTPSKMVGLKEEIMDAVEDATDLSDDTVNKTILSNLLDDIISERFDTHADSIGNTYGTFQEAIERFG